MICRTRAGLLEFKFKTTVLPFEPLDGGMRMEHGLGDVMAKGADNAEPMAGAGPCPGQDVAGGARIAADHSGQCLRGDALAKEPRKAARQKLGIRSHALHLRTGH